MAIETIAVPDIGGSADVEVIEVCVAVGDTIELEQSLVVLETDKASMEVPSTVAGKITKLSVKEGDKVSEGSVLVEVETGAAKTEASEAAPAANEPVAKPAAEKAETPATAAPKAEAAKAKSAEHNLVVPDIGGSEGVDVIELCVKAGDTVAEGDSLIVLETDKASMEIPSTLSGKIKSLSVKEGDKVSAGDVIGIILAEGAADTESATESAPVAAPSTAAAASAHVVASKNAPTTESAVVAMPSAKPVANEESAATAGFGDSVYAGPAVRKLGRQLGVDLVKVKGSGPRGRLTKDDVRIYVKTIVNDVQTGKISASSGSGIPPIPAVDFSKFGPVEMVKMSKIKKITATNMQRNWLNVPHVTQWDDADISDLEAFRASMKAEGEKRGVKLTPVPFLLKAVAAAMRAEPSFNVSMHADGEHIVQKDYVHIGMAVDTPNGLVVPVIRDVDKKGLWELAAEATAIAKKARDGKLLPAEMQGGCFTISSLGAMGGNGFTPIVNAPEVAILGVSRAQMKPVWNGKEFEPRNMLPLSLSYDHRAINGGDAGRFFTYLTAVIADIRKLLL